MACYCQFFGNSLRLMSPFWAFWFCYDSCSTPVVIEQVLIITFSFSLLIIVVLSDNSSSLCSSKNVIINLIHSSFGRFCRCNVDVLCWNWCSKLHFLDDMANAIHNFALLLFINILPLRTKWIYTCLWNLDFILPG